MSVQLNKLLDVTDRRARLLQIGLMAGCGLLLGVVFILFDTGALPPYAAAASGAAAILLFVVAAGIKQRWEIEYRGHRVRFENSPVTGEKLFLDEGLVAKGGLGMKMELRAPIRVGEGAGETIVALVDAGFRAFRLRLFVETDALDPAHTAPRVQVESVPAPIGGHPEVIEDLRPVTQSVVLGRVQLAKHALELLASLIGVVGGLIAIATWLF